jgi:hypothetical protein
MEAFPANQTDARGCTAPIVTEMDSQEASAASLEDIAGVAAKQLVMPSYTLPFTSSTLVLI